MSRHILLACILTCVCFLTSPIAVAQTIIDWTSMNEGLEGDQIDLLWQSPRGTFFAGGMSSGLFISKAYGEPWQPSGLHKLYAREITADSSGNVFIGTDAGLFYSSDEGLTWKSTNLNAPIFSLATLPNGIVFAGTLDGLFQLKPGHVDFTLSRQWTIDQSKYGGQTNEIQPINNMTVLANGELFVAVDTKLFVTKDGESWTCYSQRGENECWEIRIENSIGGTTAVKFTTLSSFENDLMLGFSSFINYCSFRHYDPQEEALSYINLSGSAINDVANSSKSSFLVTQTCGSQGSGSYFRLFKSIFGNEGGRWELYDTGNHSILAVIVAQDESWVCVGRGDGVHCTENGGSKWIDWNSGLTNAEINTLLVSSKNQLYAGAKFGAYRDLAEHKKTWQTIFLNQLGTHVNRRCIHPPLSFTETADNTLYAGITNQILHTKEKDQLWELVPADLNGKPTLAGPIFEQLPDSMQFPLCGGVYRRIREPIKEGCSTLRRKQIQSDGDILYQLQYSDIEVSHDGFETVEDLSIPFDITTPLLTTAPGGKLLVAANGSLLYSEDRGLNWTQHALPDEEMAVYDMTVVSDSILLAGTGNGIYRSTNLGENWEAPVEENQCFNIIEANNSGVVIAGDKLISKDYGATWQTIITPLPGSVTALTFDDDGTLYAGTKGWGVFKSATPLQNDIFQPERLSSFSATVYPNPAQGEMVLTLELPSAQRVRVEIYDMLGRHRGILVDQYIPRGTINQPLHDNNLSAGAYMIRVSVSDQVKHIPVAVY